MQINSAQFHVKFVKHPIIARSQFELRPTLQTFVRVNVETSTHFVNLALYRLTHRLGQGIESLGERGRPDLKRSRHDYFGWRVV